jgi:hypothetical protein
MASSRNTVKAKIKPSGNVELRLERRDTWNRVTERITFTVSRRNLERALANATLEVPWTELLELAGKVRR